MLSVRQLLWAASLLCMYCTTSIAQDARRLNIRGVYLSTPLSELKKRFPGLRCSKSAILVNADLVCQFSDSFNVPDEFNIYGGNKTIVPTLEIVDQRLAEVHFFLHPEPNRCDAIARDLVDKFGVPAVGTQGPSQSQGGKWEWNSGTETLSLISQKSGACIVSLTSNKYRDASDQKSREAADRAIKKRKGTL
jgi:hypothetical protein